MISEIVTHWKETPIVKKTFVSFVVLGYLVGLFWGFNYLKTQQIEKVYCADSIGPTTCQPDEDCDRECVKYETKIETREREAFYTYGLLGAFIGGWVAVLYITFVMKK